MRTNTYTKRFATVALVFFAFLPQSEIAFAADVPQSFTLDGRLFSDTNATAPLLDSSIAFTVQILDESKVCIVYEEAQSASTLASKGYFSIQVGTAVGSPLRTVNDSANSMPTIFQNMSVINGRRVSDGTACTVPAAGGNRRFVRIKILPPTMGGVARTLAPDLSIDSVPNAIIAERAESLQGLRANNVLQVNTASGSTLSQSNLESLFTSSTRFNSLTAVVDGTSANYMRSNSASGAQLPSMAGAPSSPTPGSIWFDSSDNKLKYQTSVGPSTLGTGAGTVTSVGFTAPTELTVAGAPISTSGAIAVTWATQTTNKVFAAPDGVTGTPTFRVMTSNDIPNLPWTKITSMLPTTLLGYGITDAVRNVGGTPSIESGLNAAKGAGATAGRVWISTDTREIYRDNGTTWDLIGTSTTTDATKLPLAGGTMTGALVNNTNSALTALAITQSGAGNAATFTGGNVGIGTTAPGTALDVFMYDTTVYSGTSFRSNGANVTNSTNTSANNTFSNLTLQTSATGGGALTSRGAINLIQPLSGSANGEMSFQVGGVGSISEVLRMTSAGNVGIGTAVPSTLLDVNGGLTLRGSTAAANAAATSQGKLFYDTATNKFKVSENNGAFVDLVGGGGTVTSVSSANSYLSVATGTTTPALTLNVGTAANTVAAGDDSRITGALPAATAFAGDLSGVYSATSVDKIKGTGVSITAITSGNFLKYNGTNWVNSNLASGDVTGALTYTPVNKNGDTMTGLLALSADPSAALGASTKQYVDAVTTSSDSNFVRKDGTSVLSLDWDVDGAGAGIRKISGLAAPTVGDGAATKTYADTQFITKTLPAIPAVGQNGQSIRWNDGGNVWEYYTPASAGVSGGGTTGKIAKFSGATAVSDSLLTESGADVTFGTGLRVTGNGGSGHSYLSQMTSSGIIMSGNSTTLEVGVTTSLVKTSGNLEVLNANATNLRINSGNSVSWDFASNYTVNNNLTLTPTAAGSFIVAAPIDVNGSATFRATNAPAAAAAQGKLYYDTATNKFKVSENNGAFVDLIGGGGTVTSVSSANSYLSVATGTTTPALTLNVGTAANTVAAGDDSRITGALPATTAFAGDVSGVYSATSVDKIKGTNVAITTITSGNFLKYNGTNWVNSNLAAGDVTGALTYTPVNKAGDTMTGLLVLSADPSAALGASTKQYVDAVTTSSDSNFVRKDGTSVLSLDWDVDGAGAGTRKISGLAAPTVGDGVATKTYVDTQFITKTLPAAPAAGQNGQSLRWNNGSNLWEYYTAGSGGGDFMASGAVPMTGPLVNNSNSAAAAVAVTQSGAGYAATFMGGFVGIGTATPSGTLDVQGGTAAASTNGVGINFVAQSAGSGGNFNGGSVNLTSGNSTSNGDGGNISLSGPIMPSQNSGGNIQLKSGAYSNAAGASYLELSSSGAAVGNGDALLRAGDGHVVLGTPGSLNLRAGNAMYNAGGTVNITGGNGGTTNGAGGNVAINGGAKQGTGAYGNVVLGNAGGNVGIGTASPSTTLDLGGAATFRATTAPAAAAAQGKLYYDTATNKFKVSENNGAFVDLVGGGGTVTSVSSANSYLSVATGTTTPALTLNVGTAANTVAAGDDSRITGALPAATAFAGDVSGVYSATSVDKIKGTTVAITTITSGNFLKYNGTNWVNSNLAAGDITGALTYTPVNKNGDTMTGLLVLSADPSAALGASTKQYVDAVTTSSDSNFVRKDGTSVLSLDWDVDGAGAGTRKIAGLASPTAGDGAATKTYADTQFITKNLPAAPAAGQNGQSIRWNNTTPAWEYYTPAAGAGDFLANGTVPMTGAFVNNTSSASTALAVTQSGAGHAASFMGGFVGIGTTNPVAPLEIYKDTSTSGNVLRMQSSTNDTVNSTHDIQFGYNFAVQGGIRFSNPATDVSSLEFSNWGGAGPGRTVRMGIYGTNGNVGIGTATPNTALDLNGALSTRAIAAPAISVAGQGRIYFDSTSNTYKVSQHNGAYSDLATIANVSAGFVAKAGDTMTGPLRVANGTTAAPSMSFSSSPTTGFYSSAADNIQVTLGGATRINIDPSYMYGNSVGGMGINIAGAGDANTPTYSFLGDLDSGMFRPAANTVAISTGTAERMRIDGSGNVGIGTTAPTSKLHIEGAANQAIQITSTGAGNHAQMNMTPGIGGRATFYNGMSGSSFYFQNSGGGYSLQVNENGGLAVGTGAGYAGTTNSPPTNGMIVQGNVGIGTATPGAPLQINKNVASTYSTALVLQNNVAPQFDVGSGLEFQGQGNAVMGRIVSRWDGASTNNSHMQFYTNNGGSMIERMHIDMVGNVGIGTTNPSTLLDLGGAATFRATTAPAAVAAQGKLYFDTAANKFKVSENNGAFVDLIPAGGGVGGTGATNAIPKFTAAGTIGDSAIVDNGTVITATRAIASVTNPIATGASINLGLSNSHTLASVGGSAITVSGMQDGGVYNIVVEDTTVRTYTFAGCTAAYFKPANGPTVTGTRTIYGLMTVKKGATWDCYITWSSGFQ